MAPRQLNKNSKAQSMPSRKVAPNLIVTRKPKKNDRPEKAVFKGLTMSFAGSFLGTSGAVLPYEQMAKWVTLHGGHYEKEVTEDTTHLICSIEEYKKQGPQVLKAWDYRSKENQCYIVVFDWLEDCLQGHKRKRAERGYTLDRTLMRIKKGKTDHVEFRKKFEEGVRASKELCDNRLHKVFVDHTGFEYKIMLTHIDMSNREKTKTQKYTLFLFESIAHPPHTYMCGAKLSRSYHRISYYREDCHPKPFEEAWKDFKYFFHSKTGFHWDQRLEGIKVSDSSKFTYLPPPIGRPVGVGLLPDYIRPELRPKIITTSETGSGSGSSSGPGSSTDSSGTDSTLSTGEGVEYDTDSEVSTSEDEESTSAWEASRQSKARKTPAPIPAYGHGYNNQVRSQTQSPRTSINNPKAAKRNISFDNGASGNFGYVNGYLPVVPTPQTPALDSNTLSNVNVGRGNGASEGDSYVDQQLPVLTPNVSSANIGDSYGVAEGYGNIVQHSVENQARPSCVSPESSHVVGLGIGGRGLIYDQQSTYSTANAPNTASPSSSFGIDSNPGSQLTVGTESTNGSQSFHTQILTPSSSFGAQSEDENHIKQPEYILID